MSISDYYENKILDHMVRGQAFTVPTDVYVALWVGDPLDTGAGGAEVTGGSYARIKVGATGVTTFTAASGGSIGLTAAIEYTGMPTTASPITHVAVCDALTGGNVLVSGALASSKSTSAGDSLRLTAITISLD